MIDKKEELTNVINNFNEDYTEDFNLNTISDDSNEIVYSYEKDDLKHMIIINVQENHFSIKYSIKDGDLINIEHEFLSDIDKVIEYILNKSENIVQNS